MFQVRTYDNNYVRYVVMTNPNLPEEDTDPPDSTLIPSGTRKDFLAEYFDKYRGAIVRKIEDAVGKPRLTDWESISRLDQNLVNAC